MPTGPFPTFDACVSANQDKRSPEAFCGFLEKITASEVTIAPAPGFSQEAWDTFFKTYNEALHKGESEDSAYTQGYNALVEKGFNHARMGWLKAYKAPEMRTITGIKAFESGLWTDSSGNPREWTDADLDKMVEAFVAGVPKVVPLKAGHTSDDFNTRIAEALGVPNELITGEHGEGQISLGQMIRLERRGSMLIASFDHVPAKIADLIEGGQFRTVSVEIEDELEGFSPVMTATALLGAEMPAVDSATLDRSLVFGGKREGARVLSFTSEIVAEDLQKEFNTLQGKFQDIIKGMRGAPKFRVLLAMLPELFNQILKGKHSNNKEGNMEILLKGEPVSSFKEKFQIESEELMAIVSALGLGEEATLEDVLNAINALVEAAGAAEETNKENQLTEGEKELAGEVATLKRKNTIAKYTKDTAGLIGMEGTPDKIANDLADIEESQGEEAAQKTFNMYKTASDAVKRAGVLEAQGSARRAELSDADKNHEFAVKVTERAKEKEIEWNVALVQLRREDPKGFNEYRKAVEA